MTGLICAISFLTRVPVGSSRARDPAIAASILWFPVVGAAIGVVVGATYAAVRALEAPETVAATLAVVVGIVLTGGLHEDGLADTADAIGARGPEHAFTIMSDPTHGTYAVLSLIASLSLRVTALSAVPPAAGWLIAVSANTVGRGAAVGLMALSRSARQTGLGAAYITRTPRAAGIACTTPAMALLIGLSGWGGLVSVLIAVAIVLVVRVVAYRRYGGVTGDVLGAAEQLTETTTYLILGAFAARSMGPA
jgi:adenosylcobinamide-GDP ribazoletransferase